MDGVDSEVGFVEIWTPKGPYLRLGLATTVASYIIGLVDIFSFIFSP
jgi:hypothetical protein